MLGLVMMLGFGRVSLSKRSCISCFKRKQLSVLWLDFFVVMAIFIEIPSGRYEIRHRCRV